MGLEDEAKKIQQQKEIKENKLYENYNEFKEKTENITTQAISFTNKYLEQIISLVVAFLLIGIQQFAEPNFDPWFFLRAKFWYEYIPYVIAIWIIINSTLTGNFKWIIEVHQLYDKTKSQLQQHVDNDKQTPFIHAGCKSLDRKRKISAWKTKISTEIEKKRKKYKIASPSALREFLGYTKVSLDAQNEPLEVFVVGDDKLVHFRIKLFKKARKERLRKSFTYLLNLLDDKYIEDNINNLKVKYNKVNESVLISGITPSSSRHNESDYKEKYASTVFDEFGVGFIVMALLSAVILALDLTTKGATTATWVFFIFKAFMLYTYYFKASARSKPIFEKTVLKALMERERTLSELWNNKEKKANLNG